MPERRNRPASRVYVETELELEEPAEDGGRYILEDLERLTVFQEQKRSAKGRLTVSQTSETIDRSSIRDFQDFQDFRNEIAVLLAPFPWP